MSDMYTERKNTGTETYERGLRPITAMCLNLKHSTRVR